MADMGWTARMATAAGTAAGAGAAQLGLGYGLGVVVWPVVATPDDSDWLGSLGWATWITASATVFGAVIASRLGGGPAGHPRGPWRWGLAISAGVGALVAVALIALPAREASVREDAYTPQAIAAGYALVGVLLGVLVAYWAVRSRPVAANLIFTSAWLWALAITAIVVELTTDRESATYLTSLQFSEATSGGRYGTIYWPSALLTVAAAFAIGILAAVPATRRGELTLGTATSGAVGPLLVAASFLILSPRLTGALGPLQSAYLIAPYAVLAGLAGSAITVAIAQARATRQERRYDPEATAQIPTAPRSTSPTGRAKLPAQPPAGVAPGGSDPGSRPASAPPTDRTAPASGRSTPTPADRAADRAAANPADRGAATIPADRGTPPAVDRVADRAAANPADRGAATTPSDRGTPRASDRGTPSAPARGPGSGPPAGRASAVGAGPSPSPAAKPPTEPASPPSANNVADAEIAEAARSARGRAKKAPTSQATGAKEPKSTVTPPPATPRIAQINPKPPEGE